MLLSVVPSITGWCVLAIAQDAAMLYAGRVLTGLGMGVEGTVHPVYVCEVCSPGTRGPLAATGVIVITTGVLISYILGTFISWKLCAWIFLSVHVTTQVDNVFDPFLSLQILMAVLVFMIPESPSWLLHKRLYERADEALAWLGMDQEEFVTEVEMDMQHRLEKVSRECCDSNPFI